MAVVGVLPDCSWSQIPSPELHWLSRQAAPVGESFELSVHGNLLEELSSVVANDFQGDAVPIEIKTKHSAKQPLRDWVESTGEFQVTSGQEAASGLVELRTVGRFGASNPRSFLLCNRPVALASSDHSSMLTAVAPAFGHIVNAHATALQCKFYRYSVQADTTMQCVVYSKQIDSLADVSLRLLDSKGHELASSRTLGDWPAELEWRNLSEQTSDYYLEVRDLLGRGGQHFAYLLECDTRQSTEQVTSADALDSQDASRSQKRLLHLDELLRPTLKIPLDRSRCLAVASAGLMTAGQTQPVSLESLGNSVLSLGDSPTLIQGDLRAARTLDFHAKQGQTLVFDIASAKLGQLTDPVLVIYKREIVEEDQSEKFRWIGDSDDAAYVGTPAVRVRQVDPNWLWTAPEDGQYRLRIADNQSGRRPADSLGFLLEVRQPNPGFSLVSYRAHPTNDPATSKPLGNGLMRFGTDRLHVTALRRDGFNGPIELSLSELPEIYQSHSVILQAGATEATLIVQAAETVNEGTTKLNVVGRALVGENTVEVPGTLATVIAGATPTYSTVLSRRTGWLEITAAALDTAPFQVALGDGNSIEVKPDSKISMAFKVLRNEGGAGECTFRPQDLPPKVSVGEVKVAADQSEATAELAIAADAAVGEYTFWFLVESKVKWRTNPQSLVREQEYLKKLQSSLELWVRMEQSQQPVSSSEPSPDASPDQADYQAVADAGLSKEKLEAAIAAATARVEQLNAQSAEKEIILWLPTHPIRIRISL